MTITQDNNGWIDMRAADHFSLDFSELDKCHLNFEINVTAIFCASYELFRFSWTHFWHLRFEQYIV
jgi:hypothetical protein